MGGTVSPGLTASVTHLVAQSWASQKAQHVLAGMPTCATMTVDWVGAVWQRASVGRTPPALDEHRLAALAGCRICVTGSRCALLLGGCPTSRAH